MMTPEQKEHATELIEMGDKLKAVRYFQQTLNITADQALALAEKLEVELGITLFEESLETKGTSTSGVNVGKLVGSIFMGVGIIMLSVITYLIVSNNKFEQRAVRTKGKVIDFRNYQSSNDNGSSSTMYTPVFEYEFNG